MSIVQNPLIGRARQKLGGTVFTTWKGINVIKGKPLTVANPRTDAQTMRRSAMTQMVAIGRSISAAINFGFKEQAVRKSQFNAFVGYGLRNAFDYSAPPVATLEESDLLFSQGTVAKTDTTSIVADQSANTLTVNWPTTADLPGQSANDLLVVVMQATNTLNWLSFFPGTARSVGTAIINVPAGEILVGDPVHVYTFFYNATSRKSSDNTYEVVNPIA